MNTAWEPIHNRMNLYDVVGYPVARETYELLYEQWLDRYCSRVKQATGASIYLGFRWHAYTYGFEAALTGEDAWQAYRASGVPAYYLFWETRSLIFDCYGPPAPNLQDLHDDVYLFPYDLAWTMIFTHESSIGLGPFFVPVPQQP